MNPVTHLLASWHLAASGTDSPRDRDLVAWAGLVPDLDGLGLVVDVGNRLLGRPETVLYGTHHHALLHGLPGALVTAALAAAFARKRARVAGLAFAAFHLHLLCDLVGSRGPTPDDVWPVPYLAPVSQLLTLSWSGQWPVNAWPNVVFTLLLLGWAFARAVTLGYSPVGLVSERADGVFVATVRHRWQSSGRRASTPPGGS